MNGFTIHSIWTLNADDGFIFQILGGINFKCTLIIFLNATVRNDIVKMFVAYVTQWYFVNGKNDLAKRKFLFCLRIGSKANPFNRLTYVSQRLTSFDMNFKKERWIWDSIGQYAIQLSGQKERIVPKSAAFDLKVFFLI